MTPSLLVYNLKEALCRPFYTKKQAYRVTLTVQVKNMKAGLNELHLILPIPQEMQSQHVEEESFSGEVAFFHDARFGNRVGIFRKSLSRGELLEVSASFLVTVSPCRRGLEGRADTPYQLTISERATYFSSNPLLESDDADVFAKNIVSERTTKAQRIRLLNEYVIGHFSYGNPIKGLYSAREAFEKRLVDCGGFDSALCALCIACGIPARIVSGFWAGHGEKEMMHAWCEIMLPNGEWIPADPSVENLIRCGRDRTKSGRLGFVGSDRIIFSVGSSIPLEDGRITDILQHPFLLEEADLSLVSEYKAEQL